MRRFLCAAFAVAMLATVQVDGQAPSERRKTWTPPRTVWGDPDLQGNYSNKYETSTPFERPQEFAGRRLDELTPQELAEALKKRQQETLDRAPFLGGDPEGRIGNSAEFRDIYEITKGSRPWFVTDPPDGKIPPLTSAGQARLASVRPTTSGNNGAAGPEDLNLWNRCITRGLPGSMLPAVYGNSYQIVQSPGFVAIRYEMVHEARVIPLDARPHVGKGIHLDMGDARGRWEGNTLVVETTNFRDRSAYRNANPDALRLVERFTRTAPDRIEWSVQVDDASTWTRPWTFAMPLTLNDREALFEYACHEGNYGLTNILSASRAVEKDAAVVVPAADGLSGAWTGAGSGAQTFVFKALPDRRFTGIVCGPCDDPAAVFRIEDGRMLDDGRITFFVGYDVGGPLFQKYGAYRDQVTAVRAGGQLTLQAQRAGGTEPPVTTVLKRVVESYEGLTAPRAAAGSPGAGSKPSPIEGKWIAAGRNAQQNFILKIRDNKVWGLICGPCTPAGVFLIDDGTLDGNNVTFYINHLDTPPSDRKTGLNRNLMRGTLTGNVMKFTWVREGAESEPGGEMTLIGPIR